MRLVGESQATHTAHHAEDVVVLRLYPPFRDILKGLDYILSIFGLSRPSQDTHYYLVVEPSP